jgi:hypothetical protein
VVAFTWWKTLPALVLEVNMKSMVPAVCPTMYFIGVRRRVGKVSCDAREQIITDIGAIVVHEGKDRRRVDELPE